MMKLFSSTAYRKSWENFLKKYPLRDYVKDELILFQDETPKHLYVIKTGIVKMYGIDKNGEERPVSFDGMSEIFPIGWVFDRIEKTQYFYQALNDCKIYHVPRIDFLRYLHLHPKMSYEMYSGLAGRFIDLQSRIYALEQSKASDKIIMTLVYLAERFGVPGSKGTAKLTIPLTQQEIANFVGLTRETTSSELKKLERMKVIKYSQKQYICNTDKLTALMED